MFEEKIMETELETTIKTPKKPSLNIASAIVVAGIIIGGALFASRSHTDNVGASPDKLDLISTVTKDGFVRGDKKAPITIIEYADFSCHFCAQFHPTLQKILSDYPGEVKWVYRHLPIFNIDAAVASQCVGKLAGEESFWNFSDALFANQDKFSSDFYRQEALLTNVRGEEYDACIADPLLRSKIQKDFSQEKILFGFNATPYNIIVDKDGRKFSFAGALPYNDIKSIIDRLTE